MVHRTDGSGEQEPDTKGKREHKRGVDNLVTNMVNSSCFIKVDTFPINEGKNRYKVTY